MLTAFATGVSTVLGLIVAGGKLAQAAAVLGVVALEGVVVGDRVNVVLNVFGGVLLIYLAIRTGRSKVKDNTIKDLQDSLDAKDGRVKELRDDREATELQKRQLEQAAAHCQQEAVKWEAKYEELHRYTAETAILHFEEALEKHSATVAGRHKILLEHDERLLEQGVAMARTLERVAGTLDRLERR